MVYGDSSYDYGLSGFIQEQICDSTIQRRATAITIYPNASAALITGATL